MTQPPQSGPTPPSEGKASSYLPNSLPPNQIAPIEPTPVAANLNPPNTLMPPNPALTNPGLAASMGDAPTTAPANSPSTPPYAGPVPPSGPAYAGPPIPPNAQPYPGSVNPPQPPVNAYFPASTPPKKARPWWVFAVVGVVIVAVIMGIMSMLRNPSNSDGSLDDDDPGPVPGAATSGSPEAAVQGYLEALAAGKAADALAYFATPAEDTTFLTDAVLAAGLAVNPITDIAVQDNQHDDTESAWIEATYSIGDQSVSGMFELADHGGSWLLEDDLAYVDLNFEYRQGVGMTLNGVSLDTVADRSKIEILPGTYTVAVSNPFLTVDGGVFVVEELDPFFDNDIAITLASDAAATLAAQATAALDACLLEKALPNSCGLGGGELEGGATPDLNTVVWSFTSGSSDFSTADFILDSYNPTKADAIINAELKIDVSDTAGDSYSGSERLSKLSVDFADPAAVRITIF